MSEATLMLKVMRDSAYRPNKRFHQSLVVDIGGGCASIHFPDVDRKITLSIFEIQKIVDAAAAMSGTLTKE